MVRQFHLFASAYQQRYCSLTQHSRDYLNLMRCLLLLPALLILLTSCAIKRSSYDVPVYPMPDRFKNQEQVDATPDISEATVVPTVTPLKTEPAGEPLTETKPEQKAEPKAEPVVKSVAQSADFRINQWWQLFGSTELSALIDRGMANNPDIRIATLHISQAKIRADLARGGQFPTLDASFAAGPQKGNSPSAAVSGASLNAAWQVDVWGEKASLVQEADFQLWQAVFDANNTKRMIASSIANSYIEYLLSNDRLKISRETEKILIGLLATIEKRAASGDATLLELEQQRSAIYSELAMIPNLEQQREDAIESLAYLLGTVPGALTLSDADLDSLHLPDAIPELPSTLLLRRPDVRSVEARLLAADVDIDVMRARMLPTVGLTSQTGYSGLLAQLFKPETFFWNAFANVATNLFDDGKLSSNVQQSELAHEEMIETYSRTILQAVREVERSLYSVRVSGQRAKLENEAMTFAQKAWDISSKIYAVGGVDFMALQETQRTYRRYMEDYQQIRSDYFHAYVSLFQALGGGEDTDDSLPGKGLRPNAASSVLAGKTGTAAPTQADAPNDVLSEHVKWHSNPKEESQKPEYWQVVLAGHYQHRTIEAVMRDLQTRYPEQMENRDLYPVLEGRLEDAKDEQASWYRLNVAQFSTPDAARGFCQRLRMDMQRCQVTSNRSPVPLPELAVSDQKTIPNNVSPARPIHVDKTEEQAAPLPEIAPSQKEPLQSQIAVNAIPAPLVKITPEAVAGPSSMPANEPVAVVTPAATPIKEADTPVEPAEDLSIPLYWKVELSERYQRRKVASVFHELQARYPIQMKFRSLTMSRQENPAGSDHAIRYRLQVAQFDTARLAWEFCQLLRAAPGTDGQTCQVVSSRSERPVPEEAIHGQ